MKKPSKTVIIASISICAIIVAVLIYTAIKYVRKNKEDKEEVLPSSTTTTTTTTSNKITYGDKGENVKKLQSYLNSKITFYYFEKGSRPIYNGTTLNSIDVDGIYGKETKCACEWWFGKTTITLNDLK